MQWELWWAASVPIVLHVGCTHKSTFLALFIFYFLLGISRLSDFFCFWFTSGRSVCFPHEAHLCLRLKHSCASAWNTCILPIWKTRLYFCASQEWSTDVLSCEEQLYFLHKSEAQCALAWSTVVLPHFFWFPVFWYPVFLGFIFPRFLFFFFFFHFLDFFVSYFFRLYFWFPVFSSSVLLVFVWSTIVLLMCRPNCSSQKSEAQLCFRVKHTPRGSTH